jgi:putative Holliday junction resolvase
LAEVVRERSVTEFVIGYPLHMDGEVGKRAKEVDEFSKKLSEKFGLPVRKVDERLTTLAAEEALARSAKGASPGKDGKIDAVAASLILQDFLEGGEVIE